MYKKQHQPLIVNQSSRKMALERSPTTHLRIPGILEFTDKIGSQQYPLPELSSIYPLQGNFISFIGNVASGSLVRDAIASFRRHTKFPSEGTALPNEIMAVSWSDQWSFWQQGYPGIMVTDTAPFRYPYYHTSNDTPDKVNYDRLARVVAGLEYAIADLSGLSQPE